jgi:hypothetical protein
VVDRVANYASEEDPIEEELPHDSVQWHHSTSESMQEHGFNSQLQEMSLDHVGG